MKLGIKRTPEDDAGGPSLNLAEAIAEFYTDFPEHKNDVFILNHQAFATGREAVAALAPQLAALQAENPQAKISFAKSMALGMFEGKLPCSVNISESSFNNKPDMKIFGRIVVPAGDEFSATLMKSIFVSNDPLPNNKFPTMAPEHNNTEMWHRYVLDHELGHAVTMLNVDKQSMKTSSFGNKAECEADAYAMIRHFQRYGKDSTFPEYVRDLRNMNVVHKGDVIHWTSRAIDRVIELNAQGKLENMTPQQARDTAQQIAREVHLSADAENNVTQAFAATRGIYVRGLTDKTYPDEARALDVFARTLHIGATTESQAAHEIAKDYIRTIGRYTPARNAPETEAQAAVMEKNKRMMEERKVTTEPELTGLKRIFRDALIDLQSGQKPGAPKTPQAGNDNKKGPRR
jgi:hypothetical protein